MSFADLVGPPKSRRTPVAVDGGAVLTRLMAGAKIETWSRPLRPFDPSDTSTYMRASSVGSVCTKREALRVKHRAAILDTERVSDRYAMSVGSAYHRMMQHDVLPSVLGQRMVGWWRGDGAAIMSYGPDAGRPILAPRPAHGRWAYEEVFAFDSEYGIGGHPDMVVDWRGSGVADVPDAEEVLEFKTVGGPTAGMAAHRFEAVSPPYGKPMQAHFLQIQVYMWLLGLSHGRLVYLRPGVNQSADSIVEWAVPRHELTIQGIKDNLKSFWASMDRVRTTGEVPHSGLCGDYYDQKAKDCPLRYECFSRKPPSKRPNVLFEGP